MQFSPTTRDARLARLLATEQLRAWGLPLDPASQLVAELAANASTHGRVPGRDFRLLLYVVADTLRIEVTDTCGEFLSTAQFPAAEAESFSDVPIPTHSCLGLPRTAGQRTFAVLALRRPSWFFRVLPSRACRLAVSRALP